MRPFTFLRSPDLSHASRLGRESGHGQPDAPVQFLAGGTTLIDLMKLDVLKPERVVDLASALGGTSSSHNSITCDASGLRIGAFATMAAVAAHPGVVQGYPVVAQSLQLAASAQIRNMATVGGNVLQRTRCSYYRDPSWTACNKRSTGSGCAAIAGYHRNHAVLGVGPQCISQYPGDFAVALIALDARVELIGPKGVLRMPISSLHTPLGDRPQIETTLGPGEIITAFVVPPGAWNRRSLYLKVRDRASYEFAIASAAVALAMDGDTIREVRIGLGGIAYRPWRASEAEQMLTGGPLTEVSAEAAATAALQHAQTQRDNAYKPELARRTLVRALLQAKAIPPASGTS